MFLNLEIKFIYECFLNFMYFTYVVYKQFLNKCDMYFV